MTPLLVTLLGAQTFDLRPRPTRPIVLNAVEARTEGATHTSLGTRFEVVGRGPGSIELSTGPFSANGRTFGRKKTRTVGLTPQATVAGDGRGRPPFLLSIPLPGRPTKVGEAWTATIVGPTPMPAEAKATFRLLGAAKLAGAPCAKIGVKLDWGESPKVTGGGQFAVRLGDGFVQSGKLNVLLVYRRPDPVTKKMAESARVTVAATIARA